MATSLETLELKISANAKEATQGLGKLIGSLSSLSSALEKPYSDLRDFNEELKKMKSMSNIKFVINGTQTYKAVERTTRAVKEQAKAVKEVANANGVNNIDVSKLAFPNAKPDEEWKREFAESNARYLANREAVRKQNEEYRSRIAEEQKSERERVAEQAKLAQEAAEARGKEAMSLLNTSNNAELLKQKLQGMVAQYVNEAREGKLSSQQMAERAMKIRELTDKLEGLRNRTEAFKKGFQNAFRGIENVFSRITRIATTMLIRKAIRGLVAAVKEGITNVREWAKVTQNELYTALDGFKAKTTQVKNSLGAALTPVIRAMIPVLTSLSNALITAANWLNQFFALLSGQSSWIRAREDVQGYTDDVHGASGATKEWLAAFDELNVMSNSGGGGGGGMTQDYENMFEEITQFDAKVREIVNFLKENLDSIKEMAIAVGAAILAWKFGNAFLDVLPTLSKLLGLFGTAATIYLTIKLNYMLMNQYLDTSEEGWLWAAILTTGIGSIAAATIAKKLIGGEAGYYAAAITLAVTAASDIIANINHTDVSAFSKESILTNIKAAFEGGAAVGLVLKAAGLTTGWVLWGAGLTALAVFGVATLLKLASTPETTSVQWGDLHLTQEQINTWVKNSGDFFTVDPETVINLTADNIKQIYTDSDAISSKLTDMLGVFEVVRLGLADSGDYANIKENIIGKDGLIDKVNTWINSAENMDKLTLTIMPKLFGQTAQEQQAWYQNDISGWETIKAFVNNLGKQLADEMIEGEGGEITAKRPERVQKILDEIARISEIIAGKDVAVEALVDMELKLKDVDQGNFTQALEVFEGCKEQMHQAAEEWAKTMLADKTRMVEALKEMVAIDPNNEELKKQLADAEQGLKDLRTNWETIVSEQADEWSVPGKNLFQEWFNTQTFEVDVNKEQWGVLINEAYGDLNKAMMEAVSGIDPAVVQAANLLNISGWDIIERESKQSFIEALGGIKSPATLTALKEQLSVGADEIFSLSGWENWKRGERIEFLKTMSDVFGDEEALNAAKQAGANVSAMIGEAMGSSDSGIREAAKRWSKIIGDNVSDVQVEGKVTASLTYDKTTAQKTAKNIAAIATAQKPRQKIFLTYEKDTAQTTAGKIAKIASDKKPKMIAALDYNAKKAEDKAGELKSKVTSITAKMPVKGEVVNTDSITSSIEKLKPTVSVKGTIANDFASNVGTSVSNAIKRGINGRNVSITDKGNGKFAVYVAASGGMFSEGQMFIAREAGPELVGQIGNSTAVANNDQIIAGIESGVYRANSEQNALLRRQNEILLGILAKETNVNIGASTGLGRTVKRSLEMYNAVGG